MYKLMSCNDKLQQLFQEVVKHQDCTVLFGHRGEAEQNQLFADKKSEKKYPDSKHNSMPSNAIDIAPYPIPEGWGDLKGQTTKARDLDWKERVKFYEFAAIVRYEAARMGIKIRCGADWDGDGDYRDQTFDDLVHFELVE